LHGAQTIDDLSETETVYRAIAVNDSPIDDFGVVDFMISPYVHYH